MSHWIDVDRYLRDLPRLGLWDEFNAWLVAEGLKDKGIREFTLHEGAIDALVICLDDHDGMINRGRAHVKPGTRDILCEKRVTYRVKTAPPREALT